MNPRCTEGHSSKEVDSAVLNGEDLLASGATNSEIKGGVYYICIVKKSKLS